MNTNELETKIKEALVSVDEAIRISKLLCTAREERIPMILNVFEKAGVLINGLEELEEWKAFKDMAYILDMDEFLKGLFTDGEAYEDRVEFRPEKFNEVCKKFNVKPSCAKRALHKKGHLKTAMEGTKLSYTVPVWKNGKAERRIVIFREVWPKAVAD